MTRLPIPGSDDGAWGTILNEFLLEAHNPDGTLKAGSVDQTVLANDAISTSNLADGTVTTSKLETSVQTTLSQVTSKYTKPAGGIPTTDLDTTIQGDLTKAASSVQSVNNTTPDTSGNVTLSIPTPPVQSVAGKTGDVVLDESDVSGLSTDLSERVTTTQGGGEAFHDAGNSGTSISITLTNGNVQKLALTGNCTLSLTAPASGAMRSLTLLLFQDGTGSRTVTWPSAVKWGNGGAPVLSIAAGKMDIVNLFTVDGGTTWYGIAGAQGF